MVANSVGGDNKRNYSLAGLGPGVVLTMLALQALGLLILFLGWVGHWAWLHDWFPGGLFAGSFPVIVTWAGAAGGIANAVRGLTSHWPRYVDPLTSSYERRASNAWSLSQGPLGAVYGSAAVLLLALLLGVVGAGPSGTLDLSPTGRLTLTAIAFIVGYHQQVFHDLVKRTVEAAFAPRARPAPTARTRVAADTSQQPWLQETYAEPPVSPSDAWAQSPADAVTDSWSPEAPAAWTPQWDPAAYVRDGNDPSGAPPYEDDHGSDLAPVDMPPVVADARTEETEEALAAEHAPTGDAAPEVARTDLDGSETALAEGDRVELTAVEPEPGAPTAGAAGQPEQNGDGGTGDAQPEPAIVRRARTATTRRTSKGRQAR